MFSLVEPISNAEDVVVESSLCVCVCVCVCFLHMAARFVKDVHLIMKPTR